MGNLDWVLESALLGLLALTLVHAIRLERALRRVRQDRLALGDAIAGFDSSTRQAEAGFSRLQQAANEASAVLAPKLDVAASLRDDLQFLIHRGEAVADRLDGLVRSGKSVTATLPAAIEPAAKIRSQAERDLLVALRSAQ